MRFWARPLWSISPVLFAHQRGRHGHRGGNNGRAVYVLIDCGYKPGSPEQYGLSSIDDIVDDIHAATGGRLDLGVITHEHRTM